jgi:hypothetical protein
MSLHFILVAGPLVRPSSWEPTAECLRAAGCHVQVPDVLPSAAPVKADGRIALLRRTQ